MARTDCIETKRFTLRWDVGMGCYRVSVPNLEGPIEVVSIDALVVAMEQDANAMEADDANDAYVAGLRDAGRFVAAFGQERSDA